MAIDDEPDILKIVELSLSRWGYSIDTFTDPVQALDSFRKSPQQYSLILTDVNMPGMSGSELVIRARNARPDIKVMVMTAFDVDKDLKKALPALEGDGFLQKPFSVADVCVAVRRHMTEASTQGG